MRRCRYCTQRPEGDVDDITLRLRALWTVLTIDLAAVAGEAELVDEQLLDWVAAAGSSHPDPPAQPSPCGWAGGTPARQATRGCRPRS